MTFFIAYPNLHHVEIIFLHTEIFLNRHLNKEGRRIALEGEFRILVPTKCVSLHPIKYQLQMENSNERQSYKSRDTGWWTGYPSC